MLREADVAIQISYVVQQNLDSYSTAVAHAIHHKNMFDHRVLANRTGKVTFITGALVQVWNNTLELTLQTSRKILLL